MSANDKRRQALLSTRNLGISAHVDAGKTTLTERILFYTGEKHTIGNVDDGNTTTDFMKQEKARGITIQSAAVTCHWSDITINLIDTPGHVDFTIEVERSMRVLDGTVIVLCAKGGVQPQTRTVWRQADRYSVPRLVFVNKMDTIGANFARVVEQVKTDLKAKVAVLELPIGESGDFVGVVDLLRRKALVWDTGDETGSTICEQDVPENMRDSVEAARAALIDTIVEFDDALLEAYLEGNEPSVDALKATLRAATISLKLVPVLCGSAFKKKGVQPLLDAVRDLLPSPLDVPAVKGTVGGELVERATSDSEPLSALAFKIIEDTYGDLIFVRVYSGVLKSGSYVFNPRIRRNERVARLVRLQGARRIPVDELCAGDIGACIGLKEAVTGDTLCPQDEPILLETITCPDPVISLAIEPEKREDADKLGIALGKMKRADPSFQFYTDKETGQTIIAGLGELHLEIKTDLLKDDHGIVTTCGKPQVSYRETVTTSASIVYTHKKQSGGSGQFAKVALTVEPLAEGGFEFVDAVVGGEVPREFIGSVEKGVRAALGNGPLGGYEVIGVKVTLTGGGAHDVDSSDMAFKIAAEAAFEEVFLKARPAFLEPVMALNVWIPQRFMGGINGDIAQRRGRVQGTEMEENNDMIQVSAEVPLATAFGYSTSLRNSTQGTGDFTLEFKRYDLVPAEEAKKLLKDKK